MVMRLEFEFLHCTGLAYIKSWGRLFQTIGPKSDRLYLCSSAFSLGTWRPLLVPDYRLNLATCVLQKHSDWTTSHQNKKWSLWNDTIVKLVCLPYSDSSLFCFVLFFHSMWNLCTYCHHVYHTVCKRISAFHSPLTWWRHTVLPLYWYRS